MRGQLGIRIHRRTQRSQIVDGPRRPDQSERLEADFSHQARTVDTIGQRTKRATVLHDVGVQHTQRAGRIDRK